MTTRNIEIDGMNGDVCIKRVNAALRQVDGVSVQSVDVGSAVCECEDEKAYEAACEAINNAGYDAHAAVGASSESAIHQERMNLVRPKGDASSSSQSSQSSQRGGQSMGQSREGASGSQGSQQSKSSQMSQGHPSRFSGEDGYTAAQQTLSQSKANTNPSQGSGANQSSSQGSSQSSRPGGNQGANQGTNQGSQRQDQNNRDATGADRNVTESTRSTSRQPSGSSATSEPTWEDQPLSASQANQRESSRSGRPGDNAPDSSRKGGRTFDSKVDEDADAPPAGTTNRSVRKD